VDLQAGIVRIVRSRHLWEESAPKTGQSARTVELLPETVRILQAMLPLRIDPTTPVFTNTAGAPVEPNSFLKPWYECLRALGIRVRGLYATKDTYISTR
jgi:integrase